MPVVACATLGTLAADDLDGFFGGAHEVYPLVQHTVTHDLHYNTPYQAIARDDNPDSELTPIKLEEVQRRFADIEGHALNCTHVRNDINNARLRGCHATFLVDDGDQFLHRPGIAEVIPDDTRFQHLYLNCHDALSSPAASVMECNISHLTELLRDIPVFEPYKPSSHLGLQLGEMVARIENTDIPVIGSVHNPNMLYFRKNKQGRKSDE